MTSQQIVDACEAAWDANKSDCGHFVRAVASSLGVALFDPNDNADGILDKLSVAPGWNPLPDRGTVEADAAAGAFIVAGLRGGELVPPEAHGHVIVVVRGDDINHPGFPMAYWGKLNGVGQKNSSIRNTFRLAVLDSVHYYAIQLPSPVVEPADDASLPAQVDPVLGLEDAGSAG